ncbi:ABC transporter substrate-binding protein (plasmid) [Agrobacterium sp. 13-2099-1-2]|uniref:ABC transporter substrate-binding protein n=1 Tax=Agrobacterium sp. 13-2099-1-2 TaxID=1841651 RepID=UPI0008100DB4|nr:ABC transporter substrate-binding protein [Agrobacterium sp. 13-2099-1-2]UZX45250.1 ABC transporter substrate-binding protein [Agrobacterium sp. 13-2099-1-2]
MRFSTLAAALIASTAAITSSALAQETLVVNSWGGTYEKLQKQLIFEPFEKANNVKIQVVTVYSADMLAQLRAQKSAPQYDVVQFSGGQEVVAAKEGLLAPIKAEELTNSPNLYPFATKGLERGEGPVSLVTAIGLLYNETTAPAAPTSWKDLWDRKYEDHLVLTDLSNSYGLLGMLMMNQVWGGSLGNLKPGLEKVGELLSRSVIITSSPEVQQNFAQNDAWIAPFSQDYAYVIRQSGQPVKFVAPKEGMPAVFFTSNLVANRPNSALAKKLIDFSLSPEVQAAFAKEMRYSPTNSKTVLEADVASEVVHGDAINSLVRFDPATVDGMRNKLVEDWKKLIAQ